MKPFSVKVETWLVAIRAHLKDDFLKHPGKKDISNYCQQVPNIKKLATQKIVIQRDRRHIKGKTTIT